MNGRSCLAWPGVDFKPLAESRPGSEFGIDSRLEAGGQDNPVREGQKNDRASVLEASGTKTGRRADFYSFVRPATLGNMSARLTLSALASRSMLRSEMFRSPRSTLLT